MAGNRTLRGVGVNDVDCPIQYIDENGKLVNDLFYKRWKSIMDREFCPWFKRTYPTYADAKVNPEWYRFSNFKAWMEPQIWQGLDLDKDILVKGNKEYGPDTCAFVPPRLNTVLLLRNGKRGELPIGVKHTSAISMSHTRKHPYAASIKFWEGDSSKQVYLGKSDNPRELHKLWQVAKAIEIEKAVAWYATQDCFRSDVADALMVRVWQLRLDCANGIETTSL